MKRFNITVNGKAYQVGVEEIGAVQESFSYIPVQPAHTPRIEPMPKVVPQNPLNQQAPAAAQPASASGGVMIAPMPGTIIDIKVTEGQKVKAGELILLLEAMKMENEIVAPGDGIVVKIHTSKGKSVSTGDSLVTLC